MHFVAWLKTSLVTVEEFFYYSLVAPGQLIVTVTATENQFNKK
jgi:hypothetical protein